MRDLALPSKALSVRQPWAWLIVNGHKDIENRTWPTRFRGRVLIHASKGMTRQEYEDVEDYLMFSTSAAVRSIVLPEPDALERGGIVGTATILDCVPGDRRSSPWHLPDSYGFLLCDARPLPFLQCKGALNFFNLPRDVIARVRSTASTGAQHG